MRVVGLGVLEALRKAHEEVAGLVDAFAAELRDANWQSPHDVKQRYQKASILGDGLVVFDLRGNRYRVLVRIDYRNQVCVVKQAGTHKEYEKW